MEGGEKEKTRKKQADKSEDNIKPRSKKLRGGSRKFDDEKLKCF
jgi:hypothetical protein